jgi:hypothetical protein
VGEPLESGHLRGKDQEGSGTIMSQWILGKYIVKMLIKLQ